MSKCEVIAIARVILPLTSKDKTLTNVIPISINIVNGNIHRANIGINRYNYKIILINVVINRLLCYTHHRK